MAFYCPSREGEGMEEGGSLVISDVSIGNVGQLAADLLISTLEMERVGFFDDPAVIPIVGAEEGGVMCTSMEVYRRHNLFVLLQRSAVVPSQAEAFAARLSEWISSCKFGLVILLSSLSSSIRTDRQLADDKYQMAVVCALETGACRTRLGELSWEVIEASPDLSAGGTVPYAAIAMRELTDVARGLLHGCKKLGVDFAATLAFCEEGDNIDDGIQVAIKIKEFLGKDLLNAPAGWKAPASWRLLMDEARLRSLCT